jgi:GDSL-like Lipase/Acylhydrolase family
VKQRLLVPITLLAVASLLAGCDSEDPSEGAAPRVIRPGDAYVALGDSYTAAPDTGPEASGSGCNNTKVNYPHLVTAELELDLVDNSCDGASTENLTEEQCVASCQADPSFQKLIPRQLQDIDEDTDLVTFRLGANDFGLFGRIIQCATFVSASGSPCTDADAELGDDAVDARFDDVQENVQNGIAEIQDRAPDARIIVLGYPRMAPDEGTCDLLPVPADDYDYVRRIIEGLNTDLESAAEAADATYIDMYDVSEGHDICGDEPWVAGAPIRPTGATAWHPYAAESQAAAELILEALES